MSNNYKPTKWLGGKTIGTAQVMNNIEQGISNAHDRLDDIYDIKNNIPYENYTKDKKVDSDGKYKHYQGYQNNSKKTYGRYEQATVTSIIANTDNPVPQVLGTDTKGLGEYTNRDSVALYIENNGNGALLTIEAGLIFTSDSVTIPSAIAIDKVKVGMILDAGKVINSTRYVGIIKSIEGQKLILEDGWWLCRNDGAKSTKGIPTEQFLKIQWTNKVWNINSNVFVNDGCQGATNMELGVIANTSNINDVGGIDLINMGSFGTHFGIRVRGKIKSFNEGIISEGNGRHFVGKKGDSNTPLLQGVDDDGNVFEITMDGALNKQKYKTQFLTSSGDLANNVGIVILNGNDINLTLPYANEHSGRIIEILSVGIGNLVTTQHGNGIAQINSQTQQISVSKSDEATHKAVRLVSDGGNLWFQLCSLG